MKLPENKKSEILNIPVTPGLKKEIQELAELKGVSVSDVVRWALMEYLLKARS